MAPEPDEELSFAEIIPQLPGGQSFQDNGGEGIGNALGSLLAGFAGNKIKGAMSKDTPVENGETPPIIDNEPFARGQGMSGGAMTRQERLQNMPPEAMEAATLIAEPETSDSEPTFLPKEKRPSDALYAEIERRQNKDFKGKDRDDDHNILDVLRGAGLGALRSLASADPRQGWEGMLGSAVGGAGAGGVGGAIDPNTDERMGNEMNLAKLLPQYQSQFAMETQRDDVDQQNRKQEADIAIAEQRPDITSRNLDIKEFRAINDAEHKRNAVALGKEKADEVKANNERIFDLKKRGLDQGDQRIKILEERNAEIKRNNIATEEGRNKRTAITQGGQDRRSALQRQMQEKLAQMRTDAQQGRQAAAIQAQKELKAMEQEYKTLTP